MATCSPVATTMSNSRASGWAWISVATAMTMFMFPHVVEMMTASWCPAVFNYATPLATFADAFGRASPRSVPYRLRKAVECHRKSLRKLSGQSTTTTVCGFDGKRICSLGTVYATR
jgi:hypothetical protein